MTNEKKSRKLLIGLAMLAVAVLAVACMWHFAGRGNKTPTSAPASQEKYRYIAIFGKELGTTVNSGFVFIDGKYIEPPYTVSQIGADIYINDILAVSASWPAPYDVTKEPEGIPPGLAIDMTYDEMMQVLGEHDTQECRYLSANPLPDKTFAQRYAEYFRQMPCVEWAESPEPGRVTVRMKMGGGMSMSVGPYNENYPEYNTTAEFQASDLHRWRGSIERALANDNALFLYDAQRCDEYDMNAKVAAEKAALFVDIVNSKRKYGEKQELLARMGIFDEEKFLFGSRIQAEDMEDRILKLRFQANGSFSQRLSDLAKKLNITPMSYNNIPSVEAQMYEVIISVERRNSKLRAEYWAKRYAELQSTTQPAQSSQPTSATAPGSKQK